MTAVCLVVQSVYDSDPRVRRKAEALADAGYAVDVLALRPAGGVRRYRLNGVSVETIALGKKRGSLARYLFEYLAFFSWAFVRLPLLMRRRRYAAIDVNTLPDFLVFSTLVARWMGAAVILDMHEITPEFYMSRYGIGPSSPIVRTLTWIEAASMRFADRVVTINQPIQDLLVARGLRRDRSIVVMNSVDEARFEAAAVEPASGSFVMMYHGTLTRIYGLDLAIEAFALARDRMPGAQLWILGSGPEREALAALGARHGLGDALRMPGAVPPADIPGWLARAHVGVLPIRRDVFLDFAFPNKLPELIVAGKPAIVSRLEAMRRSFSDQALAYFEPNTPADLARQMVRLSRDPALRARLAARARLEYAPIRWQVMKDRYVSLVGEICGAVSVPDRSPAGAPTAVAGQG